MPTSWLAHDGEANFAFLESYYQSVNGDSISFDAVRRNNSFEVEEDIISTYMEFDFEGEVADMFLSATAGVRYEMTDVTVNGTQAPITGLTILDQTEMLAGFGDAQSIATESDYDVLLPNFSVRLEITDDLIARFAAVQLLLALRLTACRR